MFEPESSQTETRSGKPAKEPTTKAMLKYFFKLSMPMILSNFTGYLILPINSAMCLPSPDHTTFFVIIKTLLDKIF